MNKQNEQEADKIVSKFLASYLFKDMPFVSNILFAIGFLEQCKTSDEVKDLVIKKLVKLFLDYKKG